MPLALLFLCSVTLTVCRIFRSCFEYSCFYVTCGSARVSTAFEYILLQTDSEGSLTNSFEREQGVDWYAQMGLNTTINDQ